MPALTQADLVAEEQLKEERVTSEKIRIPGVESLHLKNRDEIAEVLVNVLKSRAGIKEIKYVVGKYIEVIL